MRRGFERLTPLEEARRTLLAHCALLAASSKPLDAATGLICAETIHATHAIPEESIALRDGFAIAALETVGASAYAPVFASMPPQWVTCGDRLPAAADAVLPPHAVQEASFPIEILAQAAPGDGVRMKGSDVQLGAAIIEAGDTITPLHLTVLRSHGIGIVSVRIPRLVILVRHDLTQGDLIGPALVAFAKALGAEATIEAIGMNDIAAFTAKLAAVDADLILSIGGTGFGDHDQAALALQKAGSLLVHGLAMRPAETAGCGVIVKPSCTCPVVLAPGRLEAAYAIWLSLVRPCLCKMTGAKAEGHRETLPLSRKITSNPGVADVVLLRRIVAGDKLMWEPLASGDLPWHALLRAEAWHIVPPESEGYPAGALLCGEET